MLHIPEHQQNAFRKNPFSAETCQNQNQHYDKPGSQCSPVRNIRQRQIPRSNAHNARKQNSVSCQYHDTEQKYHEIHNMKLFQNNAFFGFCQFAEEISIFSGGFQDFDRLVSVFLCDGKNHANAHIERIEHITFRNMSGSCD